MTDLIAALEELTFQCKMVLHKDVEVDVVMPAAIVDQLTTALHPKFDPNVDWIGDRKDSESTTVRVRFHTSAGVVNILSDQVYAVSEKGNER